MRYAKFIPFIYNLTWMNFIGSKLFWTLLFTQSLRIFAYVFESRLWVGKKKKFPRFQKIKQLRIQLGVVSIHLWCSILVYLQVIFEMRLLKKENQYFENWWMPQSKYLNRLPKKPYRNHIVTINKMKHQMVNNHKKTRTQWSK